jgi:hypothetical protein
MGGFYLGEFKILMTRLMVYRSALNPLVAMLGSYFTEEDKRQGFSDPVSVHTTKEKRA